MKIEKRIDYDRDGDGDGDRDGDGCKAPRESDRGMDLSLADFSSTIDDVYVVGLSCFSHSF